MHITQIYADRYVNKPRGFKKTLGVYPIERHRR